MNLYSDTKHLHHACENHPVGQRMVTGEITRQEWADWLSAFKGIHQVIDPWNAPYLDKIDLLNDDLSQLPEPRNLPAIAKFTATLKTQDQIDGASYVLHGAHRRGGRVLTKMMDAHNLPTGHVFYSEPKKAEALVKALRDKTDISIYASNTFVALLEVMDQIEEYRETSI